MDLANAKAVITGGASGLGFATAERVIAAGGQVVLFDVNEELGAASVAKLGDRAIFVNTDVSNEDAVKASIQTAKEFMGGITFAVNCAGIATGPNTGTRRNMAHRDLQSRHPDQPYRQLQRHQRSGRSHATQ